MGKIKTMAYGLLLTGLLLCAGLCLGTGSAQARYENTDTWYFTLAAANDEAVTSNCLRSESQTVLLGQMELQELLVPFTLQTSQTTTGILSWTVDQPDYLQAQMLLEGESCAAGSEVTLASGENTVQLQLIPTQQALETVHEAVRVNIQVSWSYGEQTICAVFRVTLPEQTQLPTEPTNPEEETTEPTDPVEETTEPTDPVEETTEPTEPVEETTEPTEPVEETTEPTEPVGETTEPTDPVEETTEPAEPVEETTEPTEPVEETTEPTEPVEETTEPTEPVEETTEPTDPVEETTEPTEPVEETTEPTDPEEETTEPTDPVEETTEPTEPVEETTEPTEPTDPEIKPVSSVHIATLESFCRQQQLPVMVTFPEGTARITLTGCDANGVEENFLPFTRYSLDGGESYYLLYYGGYIEAELGAESQSIVLLDLSGTQAEDIRQGLKASAYVGDALLGTAQAEALADITELVKSQRDPAILTDQYTLTMQLPQQWAQCQLEYSVSMLSEDGTTKALTYGAVDLMGDGLIAVRDEQADLETLTLMIGQEPPQAGTYRITFTWKFEEICFATQQTTFFINYASDAVA